MGAYENRTECAGAGAPAKEDRLLHARRMVYDFQRRRLLGTYADYGDAADLQRLFFDCIYVDPATRHKFEKRDRTFIRIARSPLLRLMTSREFMDYLATVIRLREQTMQLDKAVAEYAAAEISGAESDALDPALYAKAFRATASKAERAAQLDAVFISYDLCFRVITELPFSLEDILRFTPKIFMRNSELLNLCISAYRIFSRHKPHLQEYARALRERETAYLDSMFDGVTG